MSPIIPALDWSHILKLALNETISEPNSNLPLFLIDSEGMGVRGGAFDFMTTSPPAIVAKVSTSKILLIYCICKVFSQTEYYLYGRWKFGNRRHA